MRNLKTAIKRLEDIIRPDEKTVLFILRYCKEKDALEAAEIKMIDEYEKTHKKASLYISIINFNHNCIEGIING